jgi:hypothetical protein
MIVKIYNPLERGWIWLDEVRDVQLSYNYAPHIYNNDNILWIVGIIEKENILRKNLSVIKGHDNCLIDPELVESLFGDSDKSIQYISKYMTEDVYSCAVLSITFMDDKTIVYALPYNKQVYLLNNEGKTIEHL